MACRFSRSPALVSHFSQGLVGIPRQQFPGRAVRGVADQPMYSVHPAQVGQCVAALALSVSPDRSYFVVRASMISFATAITPSLWCRSLASCPRVGAIT